MIRINLLPHREEKRKARRQQFYVLLGLVSVLAALIWFLGFSIINREIAVQNDKNEFLKREIASLDKEISEIKKIQEQTNALLSRKRVILADCEAERLDEQNVAVDIVRALFGREGAAEGNTDVDAVFGQGIPDVILGHFQRAHGDAGKAGVELLQ